MRFSALLLATSALLLPSLSAQAEPANRAEVEVIVKDYLTRNPEVVVDALNAYQEKKMQEAQTKSKEVIGTRKADIFEDPAAPKVGAKDADVVIAQFFDYHCGYCKHMLPVITQLLQEDKKLRVVFREFPILSADSDTAARAALAVYALAPEKYFAYHTALMKKQGRFDESALLAEAKTLGIKESAFKDAMKSSMVEDHVKKTRELARALGVSGTPAVLVGETLMPGAVSVEELKTAIANARAASSAGKK